MATDNSTLGRFDLVGIPPAHRGVPQIEVTFDIDANGIVNVSAKDLGTQKEQKITVTGGSGLSKEEIEKMVKGAEANKEADVKKKEGIDIKNQADTVIFQTEKMLQEHGDKVDKETKDKITSEIEKLKEEVKKDDTESIKRQLDNLNKVAMELGQKMYQQQQTCQQQEKPKDEKVVDAEFEKEEKKESEK